MENNRQKLMELRGRAERVQDQAERFGPPGIFETLSVLLALIKLVGDIIANLPDKE